jgi:hypothetical protein
MMKKLDENFEKKIKHYYQNYGAVREGSLKIALVSLLSIPIFAVLGYFGIVKICACLFGLSTLCFFSDYPLYILIKKSRK